jgi:hypothetical protein
MGGTVQMVVANPVSILRQPSQGDDFALPVLWVRVTE